MKCFWIHANTVYDAMIGIGNQGHHLRVTASSSHLRAWEPDGRDMTNDLTYAMLEVIDEMIATPGAQSQTCAFIGGVRMTLLDKVVDMISVSQGAPFLLNFDERSMAGMMREAKKAGVTHLINENNVHDYAPVGCLENTMQGNDRSGTVDNNLNLLKAVELALNNGKDFHVFVDPITGKKREDQAGWPEDR